MTFSSGLAINVHYDLSEPLNDGCGLAINNLWFMTANYMTYGCELTINNHWVMKEPLSEIFVRTVH